MPVGAYRHLVTLENPGPPVSDGDGGFTESWTPLVPPTMYASIQAASSRELERVTATTVLATASHLIRMAFHPGVSTLTRVTFRGRYFSCQSVQNVDQRDIALILICAEIVDAAEPLVGPTAAPATWS